MDQSDSLVRIADDGLSAEISTLGAELQRLTDSQGRELLWDGDPAFWTGRAPLLFPVVGAVAQDLIRIDGKSYPMAKHGFARRKTFAVVERGAAAATFRLEADEATRAAYPFEFRLDVRFAIEGAALTVEAMLHNPGNTPLPASFGFHPALRWPLPYGAAREAHRIRFETEEPAPIRRVGTDGLLRPAPEPTPVEGRELRLRDALFADDALIFDRPASRRLLYGAPATPAVEVAFPDMPMLGVWTKPGAGFLCIEPWQGIADPQDYSGEFRDKPGVVEVASGASRTFTLRIGSGGETF